MKAKLLINCKNVGIYKKRVEANSGAINSLNYSKQNYDNLLANNLLSSTKIAYAPLFGNVLRTSGVNNFISKGFSEDSPFSGTPNDLTQATNSFQPYLNQIAPGEKPSVLTPNATTLYLNSPSITLSTAWTVEIMHNWNGSTGIGSVAGSTLCGYSASCLRLYSGSNYLYQLINDSTSYTPGVGNTYPSIGKNTVITVSYNGSNLVSFYINGALVGTSAYSGATTFNYLGQGRGGVYFFGRIYSYHLYNSALTATQVTNRYNFLRSIVADIENVTITAQKWGVRNFEANQTPQGNIINEIQQSNGIERITNGSFTDSTGWTLDTGWGISGGFLNGSTAAIAKNAKINCTITSGKLYLVQFDLTKTAGAMAIYFGTGTQLIKDSPAAGHVTILAQATASQTQILINGNAAFVGTIDNLSYLEIGWDSSQTVYDAIYAATSGTTEQKTYAAVKASAMWCHYNNDTALGAVYGKLYNWFAAKLLQMDIDYYNTANPTTPWGYKVPASSDFTALSTALGGDSVSGGKLKIAGTTYWTTPNTGADNSSGFSALPGGRRAEDGSIAGLNLNSQMWCIDSNTIVNLQNTTAALVFSTQPNARGESIRLIKV